MPGRQKAKKLKRDRNISGLKNQSRNFFLQSDSTLHPTLPRSEAHSTIRHWGWCKYRYREHLKANFAAAKE